MEWHFWKFPTQRPNQNKCIYDKQQEKQIYLTLLVLRRQFTQFTAVYWRTTGRQTTIKTIAEYLDSQNSFRVSCLWIECGSQFTWNTQPPCCHGKTVSHWNIQRSSKFGHLFFVAIVRLQQCIYCQEQPTSDGQTGLNCAMVLYHKYSGTPTDWSSFQAITTDNRWSWVNTASDIARKTFRGISS